jgi:hypothetical protein
MLNRYLCMYMPVFMYVFNMYVCLYVCMHACVHACTCVRMYVCIQYVCMHVCMYALAYRHVLTVCYMSMFGFKTDPTFMNLCHAIQMDLGGMMPQAGKKVKVKGKRR